jgi:hypothetical protein
MGSCSGIVVICICLGQTFSPEDQALKKPTALDGSGRSEVSAKSLHGKVLCGYQGWFRCPGDPANRGWVHWSRDTKRITPETLTFEMWPDLSEFSKEEKYPALGFRHRDGTQAFLFSSANERTVERHFDWMAKYGIDGVLVQRFVTGVQDPDASRVVCHVRTAANRTGRVFAVEYDMSGTPAEKLFDLITNDWKRLVDETRITADPRYLHHNGRPVLAVWGFFSDRFDASLANRIIDFFKKEPRYRVTLVGGCQWPWREEKNVEWAKVFRRFDVISPWNVGNCITSAGVFHAKTEDWQTDVIESRRAGVLFMPVVFPGFSWDNLQSKKPGSTNIPRRRGEFYWEQFSTVARLGIDFLKVAMFDEVDEGTAIFKVSNSPPGQGHFVTYEGLPSDWYLRLTGEGAKLMRGEIRNTGRISIKP